MAEFVLASDFDSTVTEHDFSKLAGEQAAYRPFSSWSDIARELLTPRLA